MCATIHSPTPYCFNLFDRLLLLLRGRVVYFGPNGRLALDFFHNRVRAWPRGVCLHGAAVDSGLTSGGVGLGVRGPPRCNRPTRGALPTCTPTCTRCRVAPARVPTPLGMTPHGMA